MNFSKIFLIINLLFISLVFLYSLLPGAFLERKNESLIAKYNGEVLTFRAFVCEEADLGYKSRRLTLCSTEDDKKGKVLATLALYPAYDYGDFVEVKGKLQAPEFFEGFNYPAYLARYNIYSLIYFPEIKIIAAELNFKQRIKKQLIAFKQEARLIVNRNLQEPEAGLASAIIFGYKRSLDKEELDTFSVVGLRHLMAISGAHLTIISLLLIKLLLFLGFSRKRSFLPISIFLFLYPIITGLSSSAIRSAIMGFLGFSAFYFNRQKNSFRALVFSAAIMLVINPMLLAYDTSFQLSFLAVLGIIYLEPIFSKYSDKLVSLALKNNFFAKFLKFVFSFFNLTLASQLASLPVMLFSFDKFSLISPLANIFLVWTLPFIISFLIIAIFLSYLFPFLALYFFYLPYILINFLFFVSEILANFKFSALEINILKDDYFKFSFFFIYYLLLVLVARRFYRNKR